MNNTYWLREATFFNIGWKTSVLTLEYCTESHTIYFRRNIEDYMYWKCEYNGAR